MDNVSSSGRLERQQKAIRLPSVVIRFLQDDVSSFSTIIASKAFCLPSAPFAPSGPSIFPQYFSQRQRGSLDGVLCF